MNETSTAARPDLSALKRVPRVNIAVAETQGATWREAQTPDFARGWETPGAGRTCWEFRDADGTPMCWCFSGGVHYWSASPNGLPYFTHDAAAWGALMLKRLARWETDEFDDETLHRCWWHSGDGCTLAPGPWCSSLGESVCAAVLTQAGIDWHTLEPVA